MKVQQPADWSWAELAARPGLASVLDPRDQRGAKNAAIDKVHKRALSSQGSVRGLRVLDFGCGTGRLSAWLSSRGAVVDGVDATPEMIEAARRHVPGVSFLLGGGSHIPVASESYDVIVSVYVLQYYVSDEDSMRAILDELARALRPGGRLLAIEQVTDGGVDHMMSMESSDGGVASRASYARAFAGSGFTDLKTTSVRVSDSRVLRLISRLGRQLPGASLALMLEARVLGGGQLVNGRYVDTLFTAVTRGRRVSRLPVR